MRCRCDVGASAVIKARKPRVVALAGGENGAEAARRGVGVGGAMARKPRVVASASAAKMARKPRVVASAGVGREDGEEAARRGVGVGGENGEEA